MTKTPHKEAKNGQRNKTILLAILLGLAILAVMMLLAKLTLKEGQNSVNQTTLPAVENKTTSTTSPADATNRSSGPAEKGDVVEMDYLGRYLNGTIVDTSIEEVATNEGVYDPTRQYQPIVITVGMGEVPPGIENAVVGMELGDEKTITLSPENGYGEWSPENLEELPRTQNSSRIEEVELDVFENTTGQKAVAGTTVRLPEMRWSIDILEVGDNQVLIKHNPENGTVLSTIFGNTTLTATDDQIYARLEVKPGDRLLTQAGYLKVVNVSDTTITVDANHELAGKTTRFTIKIISINQAEDPYVDYIRQLQQQMQETQTQETY